MLKTKQWQRVTWAATFNQMFVHRIHVENTERVMEGERILIEMKIDLGLLIFSIISHTL